MSHLLSMQIHALRRGASPRPSRAGRGGSDRLSTGSLPRPGKNRFPGLRRPSSERHLADGVGIVRLPRDSGLGSEMSPQVLDLPRSVKSPSPADDCRGVRLRINPTGTAINLLNAAGNQRKIRRRHIRIIRSRYVTVSFSFIRPSPSPALSISPTYVFVRFVFS